MQNFIVLGYGEHGKGTFASVCRKAFSMSGISVSEHSCENVIFPQMKDKHGYKTPEACYEDRRNHRETWYNLIRIYLENDLARVAREVFEQHNILEGIRNRLEFEATIKAFPDALVIWVDASGRLPVEDSGSIELNPNDADIILTNNGTEAEFEQRVIKLVRSLRISTLISDVVTPTPSNSPRAWERPAEEWPEGAPVLTTKGKEVIKGRLTDNSFYSFSIDGESFTHRSHALIHQHDPVFKRYLEAHKLNKVKDYLDRVRVVQIMEDESLQKILYYAKSLLDSDNIEKWNKTLIGMGAASTLGKDISRAPETCRTNVPRPLRKRLS